MEIAAVETVDVREMEVAEATPADDAEQATGSRGAAEGQGLADGEDLADGERPVAGCGPGWAGGHGAGWIWGDPARGIPADAPLHTLLLAASRVMGAFYASMLVQTGLRISPAGLGVLRVLLAGDGLKSSDVAARGWSSPGTLTSVVNTLVREGYVERRSDPEDRRVVRLYVTDEGRRTCEDYLTLAGPHWQAAFDFVSPADEPVIRKFFIDMIEQFSELSRKERGR
jgi:DNA-binding MarR family transcriptional regulator